MSRLITRNPFTFPTGVTFGYDSNHVAASGLVRLSGVYLGNGKTTGSGYNQNGFFDMLHGVNIASNQSNIGHFIDGILGPCYVCGPYSRLCWFNAGGTSSVPYVDDQKGTMACIIRYASSLDPNGAGFYELMSNQNSNDGGFTFAIGNDGSIFINCPNSSSPYGINPNTAIYFAAGRPYFAAVSFDSDSGGSAGTKSNWVVRDLQTGVLRAEQGLPAVSFNPHKLATQKFYTLNTEQFNASGNDTRYATCMWSGKFHTLTELLAWSEKPWSFWYPNV